MEENIDKLDRISHLPEPILQHILSFLPIKQVVKTSIASKTWQHAWKTSQVLVFDRSFFCCLETMAAVVRHKTISERRRKRNELFNFVQRSLESLDRQKISLKKFTLMITFSDPEVASSITRWVADVLASDVEDLTLDIDEIGDKKYVLPGRAFDTAPIAMLDLRSIKLELTYPVDMKLSYLKKLSLLKIQASDKCIQSLVSGCPLIENMSLEQCYGFKTLHVFDVAKLIAFRGRNNRDLEQLEIEASNLLSVDFCGTSLPCAINLVCCKNLKRLQVSMASITDEWLKDQLSKLPQLESLFLFSCMNLERIKIAGRVKSVAISDCRKLVGVEIDSPTVQSFTYDGDIISFSSNGLILTEVKLGFFSNNISISWYVKLIEFLAEFNRCSKSLNLQSGTGKNLIIPREIRQTQSPPLCQFKDLNLKIALPLESHATSELVDGLLWLSPHLESLSIDFGSRFKSSFKFSYRDSSDERDGFSCCKSVPVSCWQSCMKDVKIETTFYFGELVMTKDYIFGDPIWEKMETLLYKL